MIHMTDIHPLTDFLRNHKEHIERLKKRGRAELLTVNGKAEIVVQDAEAYQKLLEAVERAETIAGIRRGLESMTQGKGRPAEEFFAELRKKHKIPRG
ncbi:MAG TPA: type II toxin-antitoxin system Phd/YefM family antitoxin [Phycisphaerae bacterium]|nr:type II toxin-antitoxin system Phd/YefM family antitoxin [Phycisphaerae bacterium]